MLAAIVDWAALGKVVLYSFVAALLLTGLFTTGVLFTEADGGATTVARRAAGAVCFALCLALVALGILVTTVKRGAPARRCPGDGPPTLARRTSRPVARR
jgi:hypothetical protein